MSNIKREDLEKSKVKFTIEISWEEMGPYLEMAVKGISEQIKIPGFRDGHATYEAVKNQVGEMKILEAALEPMIRKTFVDVVINEKIDTVGSPEIDVEKMAPGNPVTFTAIVQLMPQVKSLADFEKLSVEKKSVQVEESDVEGALKQLVQMQTKEVRAKSDEASKKEDKVIIDMTMKQDNVPVVGGDAKGYHVFLPEAHYIPGFSDALVGMKEEETKTFSLPFPKDHYQKHLAGKDVEFTVKVCELFHLDHPLVDEAFAASLGFKTLAELKERLQQNIQEEKIVEEKMRMERAVLDEVVNASTFEEIPELLVNEEVNKMVHELEHNISEQGAEFDGYLKSINKTIAQLKLDFTPQAIQRIKVMIVLRDIAKKKEVVVEAEELDKEIDEVANQYEDKETKDRIFSPMYRDYMETVLRNKKVVEMLKEAMVK